MPTLLKMVEDIKGTGLKLKVLFKANDYLSCDIKVNKDNHTAWIGQTTLMKKVEKKYGPMLKEMTSCTYKTPEPQDK
jgi:hypothetical protein